MKLLLTGGTGFIGSHLVRKLLQENHNVFLLLRKSSDTKRISDILNRITPLRVPDSSDLSEIFELQTFDGVIHLATYYVKHQATPLEIEQMTKTNILFPAMLLEQAVRAKVSFFLNTGTCFEYEQSNGKLSETSPINPFNYYAATKVAFEDLVRYQSKQHNLNAATLKLFFPYGENDNEKLFVLLVRRFLAGEAMEISKGEQLLNYTYVSDIVDAFSKTIHYLSLTPNQPYEIFNIGNDESITLREAVNTLEVLTGKKNLISLTKEYASDEIMHMESNNTKAKNILRWQPKVQLKDGLERMISYYRSV